jgi:L-alanine-DL-glutamate epimerase-like enolase superfamily enzyme
VIEQTRWPAVTCHELYAEDLLVDPIAVEDGSAAVPDDPGLGLEVDEEKLAEHREPLSMLD